MKSALLVLFAAAMLLFGCASSPIKQGVTTDGHPYRGSATPKVVIIEYSDFECPFCGRAQPTVEQILQSYPDDVQLQYRHFPLDIHPRAYPSALAAVCAEQQGKFWEMHDQLFSHQDALEDADLQGYAKAIGLNLTAFSACLQSPKTDARIQDDMAEGAALGVSATPTFKVGTSIVRGAQPFSAFQSVIDAEIAKAG